MSYVGFYYFCAFVFIAIIIGIIFGIGFLMGRRKRR